MSVWCACGAQWHDHWVETAAATIDTHRTRAAMDTHGPCRLLSHAEFSAMFGCKCGCRKVQRSVYTRKGKYLTRPSRANVRVVIGDEVFAINRKNAKAKDITKALVALVGKIDEAMRKAEAK
jgi:hypothetical protein